MSGTEATHPAYEGWAIVELMGHRQTAGKVMQVTLAGAPMLRIDSPGANGEMVATQIYGGSAIYCVTPCDEETARKALEEVYILPEPIRLALRQEPAALPVSEDDAAERQLVEDAAQGWDDDDDDDDDDDENPF